MMVRGLDDTFVARLTAADIAERTEANNLRELAHKGGDGVLLAALHIGLVEELLANGLSLAAVRQAQAAHAKAVMDVARG